MSNSAQRYSKTHRKGRQDKHQDREFEQIARYLAKRIKELHPN